MSETKDEPADRERKDARPAGGLSSRIEKRRHEPPLPPPLPPGTEGSEPVDWIVANPPNGARVSPPTSLPAAPVVPTPAPPTLRSRIRENRPGGSPGSGTPTVTPSQSITNDGVTVIPPVRPPRREVETREIVPGRAWARIVFDDQTQHHVYEVLEPILTERETELHAFVRDTLVRTLEGRHDRDDSEWRNVLIDAIDRAILDHSVVIDELGRERIKYYILRDFTGYGKIDVLMRDTQIEDVSCDGPNIPIYVFHRVFESIPTNIMFEREKDLDSFVIRLVQRSGKQISIADPLLDATLPDKSRLQASLSREVTTRGSSFTIRRFRTDPFTPPDLVRFGTLSAQMASWLWFAIQEGKSLLIAGGTASGKTSTLNAASLFIPPHKKIVTIEDTREINLPHANWIAGVTRSNLASIQQDRRGGIDMYRLLEAALRQRPEYLIVGEVRGPEAVTLFQAMATGHASYGTLHADSTSSVVHRLENEPINLPRIMLQTLSAIFVQAQVRSRENRPLRRVITVDEISGLDPETDEILTNAVFRWNVGEDTFSYLGKSVVLEQVAAKRGLSLDAIEAEWDRRTRIIEWMVKHSVRRLDEVMRVVSAYYTNANALMELVDKDQPPTNVAGRPAV